MHYKTKTLVVLLAGLFSLSSWGFHFFDMLYQMDFIEAINPNNNQLNQEVEVKVKKEDLQKISTEVIAPEINNQDLFSQSIISKFKEDHLDAYGKAKKEWQKNQQTPFLKYITKGNSQSFWDGLINLSLQRNDLTPNDIMWSIHEYAKPNELTNDEAHNLFNILITFVRKNKEGIQSKFIDPSIVPEKGWFFSYNNSIKFNALIYTLELGYYDEKYTKIFKEIVDILPVEIQESAVGVKDVKEGKDISLNLIAWINANKTYIEKNCKYMREAACHVFLIWSQKYPNRFPKEFGDMATILLQNKHIKSEDYAKVSKHFKN